MISSLESRLTALAGDFAGRYSKTFTLTTLRRLFESDRWMDYPAFQRTAAYAAEQMRTIGLQEVEIVQCPADGKTRSQGWVMPLAWEGGDAVLKVVAPVEEVLCDRMLEPHSCKMWSEPTPPGGVRGPLVLVDEPDALSAEAKAKLKGAFLLTKQFGNGRYKIFAHHVGAAGIISSYLPNAERHTDAIAWGNCWADNPSGWALKASDVRMTGFQISPPVAARLRRMVARHEVVCEATVGGKIGPGSLPVIMGVLPGQTAEEILLVGHIYENGAQDNASGAAAMLEAMRLMQGLPVPRRRVRILLTGECYGTYSLFTQRPELLPNLITGLNVDCVADKECPRHPHHMFTTSETCPAAVDTLFRKVLQVTTQVPATGYPPSEETFVVWDNAMSDPLVGIPIPSYTRKPLDWHTNSDNMAGIDPLAMHRAAVGTAAYARWLAEAGPKEADALAEAAAAEAAIRISEAHGYAGIRQRFFLDRARQRVLWTARLGARQAEAAACNLPELDLASLVTDVDGGEEERRLVPVRQYWGAPTFDDIPGEFNFDPRWDFQLVTASFWADGRRSIAEIMALVRTEYGVSRKEIPEMFRILERGGLIAFRRR